jgi:signal peptidase I
LIAFLAQMFPGAGLLVLGRAELGTIWFGAGAAAFLLWTLQLAPWLTMVGLVSTALLRIGSFVATCLVKRRALRHRLPASGLAISLVVAGLAVALATRVFVCEAFQIPGGSTIPTLLVGDHIFVQKWRTTPARGDVIVFRYPFDTSTDYINRVVALPGETIAIRDGNLIINGRPVAAHDVEGPCPSRLPRCRLTEESTADRSYVVLHDRAIRDFGPVTVPRSSYFVLGDNREDSYDSRVWGTVPADDIKGVATVVWYSRDPDANAVRWDRSGTPIR